MHPIDILEIYRAKSFPKLDMKTNQNYNSSFGNTYFKLKKIYPEPYENDEEAKNKQRGLYQCFCCQKITGTIQGMRTHITMCHENLVKIVRLDRRVPLAERGRNWNRRNS